MRKIMVCLSLLLLASSLLVASDKSRVMAHKRVAKASQAKGPLPGDAKVAKWVTQREAVFLPVLELQYRLSPYAPKAAKTPKGFAENEVALAKISAVLGKDDLLTRRLSGRCAKQFEQTDPARAAKIAEACTYPAWSAGLYRKAGDKINADRMAAEARRFKQQQDEYAKQRQKVGTDRDYLRNDLAGKSPIERVRYLTAGPVDPWLTGNDKGFTYYASLTGINNDRLRLALAMYYQGCASCGLSSIDGELDVTEPLLRLTARCRPDLLGPVYRFRGFETAWFDSGLLKIPGDFGPTGNGLLVTCDILKDAPNAKREILDVARSRAGIKGRTPDQVARWAALAAFIEDGAPDPRLDWPGALIKKLTGSDAERRWALAWLPNQLAESAPRPYPYIKDAKIAAAVVAASRKCKSPVDQVLALDALRVCPPSAGLSAICELAGGDAKLRVGYIHALKGQYNRVVAPADSRSELKTFRPPAEFAQALPQLRKAFYRHVRADYPSRFLLKMFAQLADEQFDAKIAEILLDDGFDQTGFMQYVAVYAQLFPKADRTKTIAAFETLGKRANFKHAKYAARLAKEIKANR